MAVLTTNERVLHSFLSSLQVQDCKDMKFCVEIFFFWVRLVDN